MPHPSLNQATFPHLGQVANPTPEHYKYEAHLFQLDADKAGSRTRIESLRGDAHRFMAIYRTLTSWTPEALRRMREGQ